MLYFTHKKKDLHFKFKPIKYFQSQICRHENCWKNWKCASVNKQAKFRIQRYNSFIKSNIFHKTCTNHHKTRTTRSHVAACICIPTVCLHWAISLLVLSDVVYLYHMMMGDIDDWCQP